MFESKEILNFVDEQTDLMNRNVMAKNKARSMSF
jgi:hypothetical protein